MVFARVAEYLSGSNSEQKAAHDERPAAAAATESMARRWKEEILEAEVVDFDLDAARPPYVHVSHSLHDCHLHFLTSGRQCWPEG